MPLLLGMLRPVRGADSPSLTSCPCTSISLSSSKRLQDMHLASRPVTYEVRDNDGHESIACVQSQAKGRHHCTLELVTYGMGTWILHALPGLR